VDKYIRSGIFHIFFIAFLMVCSILQAATYYCSPSGSWTMGTGSESNPWGQVQYANQYAGTKFGAGDILILQDGYHGVINWSNLDVNGYISVVAQNTNKASVSYINLAACENICLRGLYVWPWAGGSYVRNPDNWPHNGLVSPKTSNHIYFDSITAEVTKTPWTTAQAWIDSMYFSAILAEGDSISVVNCVFRGGKYNVLLAAVDSLLLENTTSEWFAEDGVRIGNHSTMRGCIVRDCYLPDTNYHADLLQIMGNGAGVVVSDILIEKNLMYASSRGRTDALLPEIQGIFSDQGISDFIIQNNIVIPRASQIGLGLYNARRGTVVNNTVAVKDTINAMHGLLYVGDRNDMSGPITYSDSVYVANNICINYTHTIHDAIVFENNYTHGMPANGYSHNYANQYVVFNDITNNDVYPAETGYAIINKIVASDPRFPVEDYAGVVRSNYGNIDFGAFEYTGTVINPPPEDNPPVIASVIITPNSGSAKIGDSIVVIVAAQYNKTGLWASNATINGKQIPLADQGNGTYRGTYVVASGDNNGINVEATGITLSNSVGTSTPASSTGSTLCIDAHAPVISSVQLTPNAGIVRPGEPITVRITDANAEPGLTSSAVSILGHSIPVHETETGVYEGTYVVQDGDNVSYYSENDIFSDSFESGTARWSITGSSISVGSAAKVADKGVECNVISSDMKIMSQFLGGNYTDTYTSFYVMLDSAFSMPIDTVMYMNIAGGQSTYPWSVRLRNNGGLYQIIVTQGAYIKDVGEWTTIVPGTWYWVKVHARGSVNGLIQWWVNGVNRGSLSSDFTGLAMNQITAVYLSNIPATTSGKIHWDHFQVSTTDHSEPGVIEAVNAVLTDAAGNTSNPCSSTGSTLKLGAAVSGTPVISSVVLSPVNKILKAGDTVTITVTALNNQAGLIPSSALINGKMVALAGKGNGIYTGIYVVAADDPNVSGIEATNITLTSATATSQIASSSNSGLLVDTNAPIIRSVSITPNSGQVTVGEIVTIDVTAADEEEGLNGSVVFNGVSLKLEQIGAGRYEIIYRVSADHPSAINAECTRAVLSDNAGNISNTGASSGSTLRIITPVTGVEEIMPRAAELAQNFPNPFNSSTTIRYTVPMQTFSDGLATVALTVYNVNGQVVRRLISEPQAPGTYSIVWDGTDDRGLPVSTGFYVYQIKIGSFRSVKSMVLVK
jgi:hypothetical protein